MIRAVRFSRPVAWTAGAVGAAFLLTACEPAALSTAASMRVEVEVYRGPLAKEPEVQLGELAGTIAEASDSIDGYREFLLPYFNAARAANAQSHEVFTLRELLEDLQQARNMTTGLRQGMQAFVRKYYPSILTTARSSLSPQADYAARLRHELCPRADLAQLGAGADAVAVTRPLDGYFGEFAARPNQDASHLLPPARLCLAARKMIAGVATAQLTTAQAEHKAVSGDIVARIFHYKDWETRHTAAVQRVARHEAELRIASERLEAAQRLVGTLEARAENDRIDEIKKVDGLPELNEPERIRASLTSLLMEATQVSQQYRSKSMFWGQSHVGFALPTRETRRYPITFATLMSTYADRIGLRADTLLKQLRGDDRRELPLMIALRETNPPAFLRLYLWQDGGEPSPTGLFDADVTRERIRTIEKLFVDENWTNINTVHASGQGTIRMALIKDDIGNWNLKSFDQDPSELLKAYKNVGLAGIKAAGELVTKAASGGGAAAAMQALSVANQMATGTAPGGNPTLGTSNLDQLRDKVTNQLTALKGDAQRRHDELETKTIPDLKTARNTKQADLKQKLDALDALEPTRNDQPAAYSEARDAWAKAKSDYDAAAQALANAEAERVTLPKTTLTRARDILAAHAVIVDALEGAIVRNRTATPDLQDAARRASGLINR